MSADTPTLPAFPIEPGSTYESYCDGLSMRDYFAARAMQVEFASLTRFDQMAGTAKAAYAMADAMLAAREAK